MSETILNNENNKNKNIMFTNLKDCFQINNFVLFREYLHKEYYNCDWIKKNYHNIYNTFLGILKKEKKFLIRNEITDFLYCIKKNSPKKETSHGKNLVIGKKNNDIYLYSTVLNKCVNLKNFDNRYEHFIFRSFSEKSLCVLYKFFVDNCDNICVLYNCSFLKNLSTSPQKKRLRQLCRERINKCPTFFICNKEKFGFLIDNDKRKIRIKLFISMMNKQGPKGLRIDKNKEFKNLDNINLEKYESVPETFSH